MEMEKPKSKKKQKRKDKNPEKVPLHDILNTDSVAEEGTSEKAEKPVIPHEAIAVEPQKKKKKGRKNVVSPDAASSIITVEEGTRPSSAASSRPDAWTTEGEPGVVAETPIQPRERPASRGVDNPALVTADEPSIPGSVRNLQDESLNSLPAISSPVANSTVIEDDNTPAPDIPTPEDIAQQAEQPGTPRSKPATAKSTPSTPASKFHRTLFGRPKSAAKVAPTGGKENQSRPSSAPNRRLPFVTDYTQSPSQKRPATAAAMSPRQAKSGRMDGAESHVSLRSKSARGSMRSVRDVTETTAVRQAVAYVPYTHARTALTRVIDDMKNMKMNHLSIVAQIEEHYRAIENESKEQFNSFVISLQDEQKEKLNTFRQTLETHNVEVKDRNKYWTETVQSLSKRNKELLRQKRALLLAYRTDTQKLEEERNALQAQLLGQIGEQDSKLRRLEGQLEDTRDETKILSDETDSEKVGLTHAIPLAAAVAVSSRQGVTLVNNEAQTEGDFNLGGIVVGNAGESRWKERYEKEKENHTEETERLEKELQETKALLASSGSSTEEEKKAYEDKLMELTKDLAKTKAQYDATYGFLQAVMAATDSEEQYKKAMEKVANDRAVMKEEQERLQSEIQEWEEKWKKDHDGNLPTEEERPENAQELFTQMAEVDQMMSNLDQQEKALIMLKRGQMPEAKEAPEPIVTTVKVRDPDLVAELETYKSRMSFLETKMKSTQGDLAKMSDLENQNTDLLDKLQRYEMELDAMRRSPVPVAAIPLAAAATKEHRGIPDREAATLLAAVLKEVGVIHGYGDAESWKAPHKVEKRMKELLEQEEALLKKREVESSDDESSGDSPDKKSLQEIQLSVSAVKVIQSGDIPEDFKAFMHVDASADAQLVQDQLDDARREIESLERQLADAKTGGFSSMEVEDGGSELEDINQKISEYQKQTDELEEKLREEREVSDDLRAETGRIQSELDRAKAELEQNEEGVNARVVAATTALTVSLNDKEKELKEANDRVEELEKARLENLDVDSRAEIERAQKEVKKAKLQATKIKKEKDELELQISANEQKIKSLDEKIAVHVTQEASYRAEIESARKGKQKAVKECEAKFAEKERKRKAEDDAKVKMLENKIRRLEAAGAAAAGATAGKRASSAAAVDPNADRKIQKLEAQVTELKKQKAEDQNRIKELDRDLKEAKSAAKSAAGDKEKKLIEKKVKDLEKKLETETKKFERELKRANEVTEELEQLKKEFADLEKKNKALADECAQLNVAADAGAEAAMKVGDLEKEVKQLTADNKTLTDNYTSERVLRKKYYNMVEDMKGKIRVYCRYRPMSKTERANGNQPVVKAPDEYTVQVEARGLTKEFQFDQIFTNENSQEDVFEDTFNLVQSAVDGYNVCIFAYGQTGSGKTYTMIGDRDQTQPGIAPRAFRRIFELIEENKQKLKFQVSCYMMELYNDKLIDLLAPKGGDEAKMDIKKDKKGMVFVQGANILQAADADELYKIFEKGSESRHVASTKMNDESSRSHLIIAIIMESVNLTTGAVTRGKLSLVDLAGSERVGKTGATAEQLKEANSINKSLSALGDVISALSSEQSFIPYRNNKLTMLMQDSLGGNAKTLMFVNISPADYNADETAISLTYASRVKLITNDASKNADSREVARLRSIISKLKAGESIEEDEQ